MNFRFLVPGKAREAFLLSGYQEYLKRLSKYAKCEIISLPEEPLGKKASAKEISAALKKEADRRRKQIKESDYVFLIDIHGKEYSSREFASLLSQATSRNGNIDFVFGSSRGLDDSLRKRADSSLSLSNLTFTHYRALLLVLEQVYRARKINSGESYDK